MFSIGGTRTLDIHNDVNHISKVTGRFDPAQDVGPSATGNSSALSCGLPLSFRSRGQRSRFNKTNAITMKRQHYFVWGMSVTQNVSVVLPAPVIM
jgi:hypothetical protein